MKPGAQSRVFAMMLLVCSGVSAADTAVPSPQVVNARGFCPNGVIGGTKWPDAGIAAGLSLWGSYCAKGNDDTGRFETGDFPAPAVLNFFLAGYPGLPGRRLLLKNVDSGEEKELSPRAPPKEEWQFHSFSVPAEWAGKPVRLMAEDKITGPSGWLGFSMPVPASAAPIDTNASQSGFCPGGAYIGTRWPDGRQPKGIETWGSYCKSGDAVTGWGASPAYQAGKRLNIYIAGYPDTPGLTLALENLRDGSQFRLHVPAPPAEVWTLSHFDLPQTWEGQPVRLIARDFATGLGGWLAFSGPVPPDSWERAVTAADRAGRVLMVSAILLFPPLLVFLLASARGLKSRFSLMVAGLLTLAGTIAGCFISHLSEHLDATVLGAAWLLAAATIIAYATIAGTRSRRPDLQAAAPVTTRETEAGFNLTGRRRGPVLAAVWGLAVLAVLPAVFHWAAPPPYTGAAENLPIAAGYFVALALCFCFYRAERTRLSRAQTIALVFLIVLLTCIVNHLHNVMVDHDSNVVWQKNMQDSVIQLYPGALPHSYRFLPNGIVRWIEMAHIDFPSARDLYRLLAGLLLFYSIYKYARLYCNYNGAIIAMLCVAVIFPVSFENYAGQLTDPLSHLSFVLALIFLETGEFAFLLTTLVIGSLAKETILAMGVYYILFRRKEANYPLKAIVLCAASALTYWGVRLFVLRGPIGYGETSGVGPDHILRNWENPLWPVPFLLTAAALLPMVALGWKRCPVSLKQQTIFLLPVLFISSLLFSWLYETRNFMPLVFVCATIAGTYFTRQPAKAPLELVTEQEHPQISTAR